MSDEPTLSEIRNRIRELLGRATLLRARGESDQALRLVQEAVDLDQNSWESHELAGDLYLDMGRGEQALDSYRRARQLNESRGVLEEKIGRAALVRAARQRVSAASEALLAGRGQPSDVRRKPGIAALLSFLIPGLGQLYNGEVVKGFIMAALFLALFGLTAVAFRGYIAASPASSQGVLYGPRIDATAVLSELFSGINAVWVVLLIVLWIYSIADAGIRASKSLTSDSTGLV
jgi:tetratricopeptide (TPR) repeat protein